MSQNPYLHEGLYLPLQSDSHQLKTNDTPLYVKDLDTAQFERRVISPSSAGFTQPSRFLNSVPEQASVALARKFPPGEEYLVRLNNVVAQGHHGILRTQNGIFVPTTKEQDWNSPDCFHPEGEAIHLKGPAQYIARRYGENYFHWTYQSLASLLDMQAHGLTTDRLIVTPLNGWRSRTLELAGADPERCTVLEPNQLMHIDEVLVSAFVSPRFVARPTQRLIDLFAGLSNRICPSVVHGAPERIYISRVNAPLRPIVNETEVCRLVEKYGFDVVETETMSVDEQVRLFAGVRCVIAPHGAGLVNLLYSRNCQSVTEILQAGHFNQCMFRICQAKGIPHHTLQADCLPGAPLANESSQVDLEILERHLQSLTGSLVRGLRPTMNEQYFSQLTRTA